MSIAPQYTAGSYPRRGTPVRPFVLQVTSLHVSFDPLPLFGARALQFKIRLLIRHTWEAEQRSNLRGRFHYWSAWKREHLVAAVGGQNLALIEV